MDPSRLGTPWRRGRTSYKWLPPGWTSPRGSETGNRVRAAGHLAQPHETALTGDRSNGDQDTAPRGLRHRDLAELTRERSQLQEHILHLARCALIRRQHEGSVIRNGRQVSEHEAEDDRATPSAGHSARR